MIVVDTNQIAYLLIGGDHTEAVRQVFLRDPAWSAPLLWRSEFRRILARYIRRNELTLPQARQIQAMAEQLLAGREYFLDFEPIFQLIRKSRCSAYGCEFVALAAEMQVPLITSDRQILREFPGIATAPEVFSGSGP